MKLRALSTLRLGLKLSIARRAYRLNVECLHDRFAQVCCGCFGLARNPWQLSDLPHPGL